MADNRNMGTDHQEETAERPDQPNAKCKTKRKGRYAKHIIGTRTRKKKEAQEKTKETSSRSWLKKLRLHCAKEI